MLERLYWLWFLFLMALYQQVVHFWDLVGEKRLT